MIDDSQAITLDAATRLYWEEQAAIIRARVEVLRTADTGQTVDAIHDIRVAARRCQSTARAYAGYLPDDWPDKMIQKVRPIRKACDRVRDLDVLQAWLSNVACDGKAWRKLQNKIAKARGRAMKKAGRTLFDPKATRSLLKTASKIITSTVDRESKDAGQITTIVMKQLATAMLDMKPVLKTPGSQPEFEQSVHQLRILGKNLRYCLEMALPALDDSAQNFLERLRDLQDSLGALHDRFRFEALLENLTDDETCLDNLKERLAAERQALRQDFEAKWRPMDQTWFEEQIKSAIQTE